MYKIYLKAFDKSRLQTMLFKLQGTVNLFKVDINVASIPTKYTKFTLLKSPHVDKKARAQFEQVTYKKHIILKTDSIDVNLYDNSTPLLYHLISATSLEVQLKVTESIY